jgi:uncharacterized protein YegJ (DUF2314 family)
MIKHLPMRLLAVLIFCFSSLSCPGMKARQAEKNNVISVESEDPEMNRIIDEARGSVDEFVKVFDNPQDNQSRFLVKYPFETDSGSDVTHEHIWLSDLEQGHDTWWGTIANDVYWINDLKAGDRVKFDMALISDWMYVEDGYLAGGESIKYLYKQMSPEEQEQFREYAGFVIR